MIDRDAHVTALAAAGLRVTEWRDEPNATYPEHAHPTREVRIVLEGHMTMTIGAVTCALGPGDRIELAPMQPHSAQVGAEGVHYLAGTWTGTDA